MKRVRLLFLALIGMLVLLPGDTFDLKTRKEAR